MAETDSVRLRWLPSEERTRPVKLPFGVSLKTLALPFWMLRQPVSFSGPFRARTQRPRPEENVVEARLTNAPMTECPGEGDRSNGRTAPGQP